MQPGQKKEQLLKIWMTGSERKRNGTAQIQQFTGLRCLQASSDASSRYWDTAYSCDTQQAELLYTQTTQYSAYTRLLNVLQCHVR